MGYSSSRLRIALNRHRQTYRAALFMGLGSWGEMVRKWLNSSYVVRFIFKSIVADLQLLL